MLRPLDVTDGPAKPTASSGACQQNGQQQECDQQRSCGARSRQQRRDHDERGEDRPSAHGERGDRRLRSEIVSAARIGALRLRASGAHQRRAHPCRSRAAGRRGRAGRERQLDFRHVAVIDRHRAVRDERSGRRTNNGGAPQAPVRAPGPQRPLGNREWSILRVRRRRTEHRLGITRLDERTRGEWFVPRRAHPDRGSSVADDAPVRSNRHAWRHRPPVMPPYEDGTRRRR